MADNRERYEVETPKGAKYTALMTPEQAEQYGEHAKKAPKATSKAPSNKAVQ